MSEPAANETTLSTATAGHSPQLRWRLFLLAASGLVPLAIVLLLAAGYLAQERRATTQRSALELSRALATAVDSELLSTVALLENLAVASDLQGIEPSQLSTRFAGLAHSISIKQGWRSVLVLDDTGKIVMRAADLGRSDTVPIEPRSVQQLLGTGAPAVGRVSKGPQGNDGFAVRIPVFRDGKLRYVLSAAVPTDRILSVLGRQQLPKTWVVAVYDQDGNRAARTPGSGPPRFSKSLEALVQGADASGMGITRTLEGVESHTGYSRVRATQWLVAVGIPAAEADADLRRLLAAVGAGTLASLALLAWLAWRMARSISGPISGLKQAASALGAGERVELPVLGVQELDDVAFALRQAAIDRETADARRSKVETEREELLVRLESALRQAELANRNKDEFLALLGHELRNPLAPITNALHLMNLKGDSATARERGIIQRQLRYVTRLVDDLLDASRITSKRFVITLRPLRPVALLEQTVESLKPTLATRELRLEIEDAARSLWVRADEARLVQVFNNLLGNAVKFTGPDGSIEVRVRAQDGNISFVFTDDGAGMAADDLARAFDLFYQAVNSARGVNGGLGLGLAIVKSLVEMHEGTVQAHSDGPDMGTAVTVSLPACDAPAEAEPAAPQEASFLATPVLVVDDNEDAADTLAALLDASGFRVQVAYSPQAAFVLLQTFTPELAILDIGLPGMDGYELARRLRAGKPAFAGPLIALTGYGQQQDVQKARAAGFNAHLTKPVEPDALLQLIRRLLAGEQQH